MLWKDHYIIGIDFVDLQHKRLFKSVDDFKESINTNQMYQKMADSLKFVVSYTVEHFAAEEKFMQQIDYPHFNTQKRMHDSMVISIQDILIKLKQKKIVMPSNLLDLYTEWLINHILREDLKIIKYLDHSMG